MVLRDSIVTVVTLNPQDFLSPMSDSIIQSNKRHRRMSGSGGGSGPSYAESDYARSQAESDFFLRLFITSVCLFTCVMIYTGYQELQASNDDVVVVQVVQLEEDEGSVPFRPCLTTADCNTNEWCRSLRVDYASNSGFACLDEYVCVSYQEVGQVCDNLESDADFEALELSECWLKLCQPGVAYCGEAVHRDQEDVLGNEVSGMVWTCQKGAPEVDFTTAS